jgi:exodeoxyribonuclease V beta subunit
VAAGIELERLLLVTFTRAATSELRERVRERLTTVELALGQFLVGAVAAGALTDPVSALLAKGERHEVELRRDRLTRALAGFDAATIATTHGFCQEVLGGLGIAGDLEPDVQFVEDLEDLTQEVIDDLYVRKFARRREEASLNPFGRRQAASIAEAAIRNPDAAIAPAPPGSAAAARAGLAAAARAELERRKRRMGLMTYDDLLTRLDGALRGPSGPVIVERLRDRFEVALVDEFQDTDPVQWRIMRTAFATEGRTLIVIADPKQAIYAFRGADVYAYLEAARSAASLSTLSINRRSDQPLIDAYDALFGDAQLGHPGIVYRPVQAAPEHRRPRLLGTHDDAPLRIRIVPREEVELTPAGFARAESARVHVARDVAADIVALLASGGRIEERAPDATAVGSVSLRPGHLAVLVRTNKAAALVRDALEEVDVPAVINGAGSVFGTDAARDWRALLEALERPTSPVRTRTAALTSFVGWSAEEVALAPDAQWEELHRRLHDWARILRGRGVAALLETITLAQQLPARLLAQLDGERQITDVRHVGQLLHAAASHEQLGVTALTAWLRRRIDEADSDTADEDRSRRLESDAEAVQVLTIHRSKGLEFPIVYVPYLWDPVRFGDERKPVVFHDQQAGDARTLDVALEGAVYESHRNQQIVEERGEELRLAYVALTRAYHQAVVWWAGSYDSRHGPLTRLLFSRGDGGAVAPAGSRTPGDAEVHRRCAELAAAAPGRISVAWGRCSPAVSWSQPPAPPADLEVAEFDRSLDWRWRRTSYSDITSGTYEALVGSEPEEALVADEPDRTEAPLPAAAVGSAADGVECLLAEMGTGVRVGTLVHRVLEACDFASADLDRSLSEAIESELRWRSVELGPREKLLAGLRAVIATPLGPLTGGLRLRDVDRCDRLNELTFELPLAGGDTPSGAVTLAAIARVLRRHLPPGDPLHGYADRLSDPGLRAQVRGYLTGSLDLVVRMPGAAPEPGAEAAGDRSGAPGGRPGAPGSQPRYAVVDYKTNWLGAPDEPLTLWHYRAGALVAEMVHAHYGLQAILYVVALHRYLRWRVPGYDPDRDLAGVLYLFVRGMHGTRTPAGTGVFSWRPPGALVNELSDLLDRGAAEG